MGYFADKLKEVFDSMTKEELKTYFDEVASELPKSGVTVGDYRTTLESVLVYEDFYYYDVINSLNIDSSSIELSNCFNANTNNNSDYCLAA